MKFPPTSEIRRRRKMLDITQAELAAASGVSQSTITKIEKGRISTSYETVVRLFETLDAMAKKKHEVHLMDIASKDIASVQDDCTVHEVTEMLRSTGYSQIPVFRGDSPVGSISERSIFRHIGRDLTLEELSRRPVSEIMEDSFPIVPETASIDAVSSMLLSSNAVLITRRGKIVGMITNADLLKLV